MIIRFPRVIYHKSIFQANLVKLFLWKFLTFLDNISICQAVSSLPTKYLLEIFYFWCWLWLWSTALSDAWNQKPPTFMWMTRPALGDQNQRQNFWELLYCLYLTINQRLGCWCWPWLDEGDKLVLQVMDCWPRPSPSPLSMLHSNIFLHLTQVLIGLQIFSPLTIEMDSLLALLCMKSALR